ncbi:flagellar biosynthesis repressor FlbT [Trichlorobacter lovleyi]|uniref:Flagellar FlbT family protein n=1 Tax=Trichlorobacter lovleyi (strain ATCC BAA-1151 / DSM 17278 / SZ) TaxID=398767 RepID=B3EBP0_TRIL1|nr:flagellar biosynthesis repressor FlbT [Trichlorobacter lovleyi]ACD97079.1 flagellar FlbT family protein [Trichlorobacter lovleyi SZ]
MSLKIRLKPLEKMLIGNAVITNGDRTTEFFIENKVPILREKELMKEDAASTPGRRIYFLVQLMYVDEENFETYHNQFWEIVRQVILAAPSTTPIITDICHEIMNRRYYQALKEARHLVDYEQELVDSATVPEAEASAMA